MKMSHAPATSHQERPTFFPADGETLFGILTSPTSQPQGRAVIVLSGGGTPLSTSVNRLSVRLCRRFAAYGFHALRFDYHGVGESSGTTDRFRLDHPFVADPDGAMKWLRGQGIERFVLVGSCFGARTALATAASAEGVEAVALVAPPVRDFEMGEQFSTRLAAETMWQTLRRAVSLRALRGLGDAHRRRAYGKAARERLRRLAGHANSPSREQARYEISANFLEPLHSLAERRISTLIIYGEADGFFAEFERATSRLPDGILKRGDSTVRLTTIPGHVHGFTSVEVQEKVLNLLTEWVARLPRDRSQDPPRPGRGQEIGGGV